VTTRSRGSPQDVPSLRFRHPVEADHLPVVRQLDAWSDSRAIPQLLPRLWFRHFSATAWLAETDAARLVGVVVGFASPDRSDEGRLNLVAVDPNLRRRGIGRGLVERLVTTLGERGVTVVEAIVWAGDRPVIDFCRAIGFVPDDGPGTTPIYGVPAFADYDSMADDKVRLVRRIR
jgi:GNAT superfamily N-acetyltransferase